MRGRSDQAQLICCHQLILKPSTACQLDPLSNFSQIQDVGLKYKEQFRNNLALAQKMPAKISFTSYNYIQSKNFQVYRLKKVYRLHWKSHLAAKAKVVWRTVQCSPFMSFFVRTPQSAFTVTIQLLFYRQAKQVSEGKT